LRPSADRLAHLDFWTHTTFSLRDSASGAADESRTAALDFPPPQLAALRMAVAGRLQRHLEVEMRSPSYESFMAPLEEFVLAQRLARAALEGRLGRDFPLAKLLDLQAQTRRFVPEQPTIRSDPTELLKALGDADPRALDRFRAHVRDQSERARSRQPVCAAASR
jgi:hypothetical protein